MCPNPTKTAPELMLGIRPTLVSFLALENVDSDTEASVLKAYDAAEAAVAAWTPGTGPELVVEAVQAANSVFQTLPVPDEDKLLAGIITGGFTGVIAIIEANSTTSAVEQAGIVAKAVIAVNAVAPHVFKYHRGIFAEFQASPAKQYHDAWNKAVDAGGFPATMKVV